MDPATRKKLSIVLPVFNEEENIQPFGEAVLNVLTQDLAHYDHEILFVNDGSSDATLAHLRSFAAQHPTVRCLSLSRNFGHQAALTAGMERASGHAIISMDADFQDPPELLPQLVERWEKGAEIVYARRINRNDRPFKKWSADLYYRLLGRVADIDIPRQVGDFRLIDRVVLRNLMRLGEHARYLRGMVAWLGFEHAFVDFDRPERRAGTSHYPLHRMTRLAMDGLLNFSFSPLKIGFWVGLASICISTAFLLYMLAETVYRGNWALYPLFKWLVVVLFGFVGAQFMLLWILGEYIGRIYNDVRRRPLYVVREEINFPEEPPPPCAS